MQKPSTNELVLPPEACESGRSLHYNELLQRDYNSIIKGYKWSFIDFSGHVVFQISVRLNEMRKSSVPRD